MKKPQLVWDIKPVSYILGRDAVLLSEKKLIEYGKIFVLVDENTRDQCLPVFQNILGDLKIDGVICINADNKTLEQTIHVWKELSDMHAERSDLLINLGGGVITDLGGFAAATYKRGINFINYPTSLLAMVDAAIGGKTGLDFMSLKNQIGLFVDPVSVIIDSVFLKTLDETQLQSGFAELLKCGLIMDTDLWDCLVDKTYLDIEEWDELIVQSARNKVDIVRHDTFEQGLRKILNFGHTVGHAIESHQLKKGENVTHGAAVAAGMICEAFISNKLFSLNDEKLNQVVKVIDNNFERFNLTVSEIPDIVALMTHDKKNKDGKFMFSLLKRLGKAVHDIDVEIPLIEESLKYYMAN